MFRTIQNTGEGVYKEKGSKFYGYAYPCHSVDVIKEHLNRLRKENPGCVHVCYAYCLGSKKEDYRYSDDGEPSNSAGAPIFGQIKSFELTNVLVAVVRYYGGTNLGVGGLINAYRTAAKEAFENATIIEDEDRETVELTFTYEAMPFVMNIVKASDCNILEQDFKESPKLTLSVPESNNELRFDLESIKGVHIQSVDD
ncbi:YigZ family protein [Crocinitomicaceae bacterium]|nr:YigZ family protein [Crocinitomicaceae bacterium]MDC0460101.1 YigZ family protein [Crocinitomicaceae bacterium]